MTVYLRGRVLEQPQSETELLQQINLGIASATWQCYHTLREKRRAGTLTLDEQQELIAISDAIEEANADAWLPWLRWPVCVRHR